jgi:hypothetical protein
VNAIILIKVFVLVTAAGFDPTTTTTTNNNNTILYFILIILIIQKRHDNLPKANIEQTPQT